MDNQPGKQDFKDMPSPLPENKKDVNFAAVAPKQHTPAKGHDTYQGIPGDGIVPA